MTRPVVQPVSPMLAKLARELPIGEDRIYEPKWDGFRCIVFKDGDDVELGSRNEKPLTRYFPEVVEECRARLPDACVLDGEIVIAASDGLDFDALLQRIHPAASRIEKLAASTPASFVAFDLLAIGDEDLRGERFDERRRRLEETCGGAGGSIHVTPATRDPERAIDWFSRFEGAGLDGVVAKSAAQPYLEGQRAMVKVKHERTADCAVAGFRWHKAGGKVGSLLLGLFDDHDTLHHVGVTSSFTDARRLELIAELEPYLASAADEHPWSAGDGATGEAGGRVPGAQSRWASGSCARSPTTISRATGSATPPRSGGGARTGIRCLVATTSSRLQSPPSSRRSSARRAEPRPGPGHLRRREGTRTGRD
jgi:ATP-dependent DNA ligase